MGSYWLCKGFSILLFQQLLYDFQAALHDV